MFGELLDLLQEFESKYYLFPVLKRLIIYIYKSFGVFKKSFDWLTLGFGPILSLYLHNPFIQNYSNFLYLLGEGAVCLKK